MFRRKSQTVAPAARSNHVPAPSKRAYRRSRDATALSLGVAAVLAGSVVPATGANATPAQEPLAASPGVERISCSTGNFIGEAEFVPEFGRISGVGHAEEIGMRILRYKITKLNGQSGGNKANLRGSFTLNDRRGSTTASSGDDLRQDGAWHDMGRSVRAYLPDDTLKENGTYAARVNFTFDKSGSDPECASIKTLAVNPVMTGKSEQVTTRYDDLWGSCHNNHSVEQTCTITRQITRTNTYTAQLGVPTAWLTGNISKAWADTFSYTNGWNPKVSPGKTAYVYGTGTRTDFTVAWRIGSATSPWNKGTAYQYNGSTLEIH